MTEVALINNRIQLFIRLDITHHKDLRRYIPKNYLFFHKGTNGHLHSIEAEVKFRAVFQNDALSPIDIFWIDYRGSMQPMKRALLPGSETSHMTYFTHPWVFQRSVDKKKLNASANGVENVIFEGKTFGATPDDSILVSIGGGGNLFSLPSY